MNIHKMQAFLSKKSKSLKNMENSNITFILHFIKYRFKIDMSQVN